MTWHDLIREARERANLSQAELAAKVGCSQAAINKIENEKPTRSRFLLEIINQLGLSLADFPSSAFGNKQSLASGERMVRKTDTAAQAAGILRHRDPSSWASSQRMQDEIPIYSAIQMIDEIYIVDSLMEGTAKRLPMLQGVDGAYAITSADEAMIPEFEPGDILFANPRQVIVPGNLCAFYNFAEYDTFIIIRRYLGQTETHWRVSQHNPFSESEIEKGFWFSRHRLVAKIFR